MYPVQHPDDRSRLGPPGFPCAGQTEQRELSGLKLSGGARLAAVDPLIRWPTLPVPGGRGMPASVACQLEAFRLVPATGSNVHSPEERPSARAAGALLPKQRRPGPVVSVPLSIQVGTSPSGHRAPPILRVPSRPRTVRNRLRDSGQVVFRSRPFRLPCRFRRHPVARPSRGRSLGRSVGLSSLTPQEWGRIFGLTCIERPGVIHNVNTRVFHNCGYRISLPETHCENTISPAPDHGPRRGESRRPKKRRQCVTTNRALPCLWPCVPSTV